MPRYGSIHRISDFVDRLVPKRGSGEYSNLFIHSAIKFLKFLDSIQEKNPSVTIITHAGDAIWVIFQGRRLCFILPTQKFFRVGVPSVDGGGAAELAKFITRQSNATHNIEEMGNPRDEWRQWRIGANQVEVLVNFISQLPLGKANSLASVSHPRHFPGPVRQLALEQFNREGRKCPGVPNLGRKKHRLSEGDTIEFDHLLPHSHGGSSSEINIQVLCVDCNRAKAATTF